MSEIPLQALIEALMRSQQNLPTAVARQSEPTRDPRRRPPATIEKPQEEGKKQEEELISTPTSVPASRPQTPPRRSGPSTRVTVELVNGRVEYRILPTTPQTPECSQEGFTTSTPLQQETTSPKPSDADELPAIYRDPRTPPGPIRTRVGRKIKGRKSTPYPCRTKRKLTPPPPSESGEGEGAVD